MSIFWIFFWGAQFAQPLLIESKTEEKEEEQDEDGNGEDISLSRSKNTRVTKNQEGSIFWYNCCSTILSEDDDNDDNNDRDDNDDNDDNNDNDDNDEERKI